MVDGPFDVVVVGGGPAGATAANDLARLGRKVALLDKAGRIKPCGGAIPPRLIRDFAIPASLLKARVSCATMISPKGKRVDMPIDGGYVGMVDRAEFDEFLRVRATEAGATRVTGQYERISREFDGTVVVHYSQKGQEGARQLRTKLVVGAVKTIRKEGAPIPLKPLKRWDNGRDVLLAGDAAGVVAPASGEGIYYAMFAGRLAAEAVQACLTTGDARALAQARRRFMKAHGIVFWILGIMQYWWYSSDKRREGFVNMCRDPDVQRLTWESYMNKEKPRSDPLAHIKIFFKDLAHLLHLVEP